MSDAERGFGLIGPLMGPAALGLAAQILADEDPETLRTARADPRMFDNAYGHLVKLAKDFDWKASYPELQTAEWAEVKKFDAVDHLIHLDIGPIYKRMEQDPKFGLLGIMARASKASLAALPAESFCERIISAGNIVLTKENLRLDPKRTEKMALLRINRRFMQRMRLDFPKASG
ncbi:hypothetical protein M885DRAFT_572808 [Pelagophyceae sp. CCMP2097]|nr:hypothetical protein M885DRAFT_572808 [Pelagophyceae sp. CCMP2097]